MSVCVRSVCLTSGPMCSVCVVRSVIWQSFIFRAALALSCIRNKHTHQPCPKSRKLPSKKQKTKKITSNANKSEQLNALPADACLASTCNIYYGWPLCLAKEREREREKCNSSLPRPTRIPFYPSAVTHGNPERL